MKRARAIAEARDRRISAANFLETATVIDRSRDPVASRRLDELLHQAGIIMEAVNEPQVRIAREAYRDFGKGCGRPAQLNFSDSFAYVLAIATGEPLLFKGSDFAHTDVTRALA